MDFLQRVYYWLWTHIGGRPWTEIWRDIWVKYEWIPQTIFFFWGAAVAHYNSWFWVGIVWACYSLGYVFGHFHWQDKFLYKRVDE
jgi:hypothetical protein